MSPVEETMRLAMPGARVCLLAILVLVAAATAQLSTGSAAAGRRHQTTVTRFGVEVSAGREMHPTATAAELAELGARWERAVVGGHAGGTGKSDNWCKGASPSLARTFSASTAWLMVFDGESCSSDAPARSASARTWRSYIARHYIPGLKAFLNANARLLVAKGSAAVIEVWNEENCCLHRPLIRPRIYATMLVKAALAVAGWDRAHGGEVRTAMGGLWNPSRELNRYSTYLRTVLRTGRRGLRLVGPIALHVCYGLREPRVWSAEIRFYRALVRRFASVDGHHAIWVSESGASGRLGDRHGQAFDLRLLFRTLKRDRVPVIIWFSLTDTMRDSTNHGGWGLFDSCGLLKRSGAVFAQFARHLRRRPHAGSPTGERIVRIGSRRGWPAVTISVVVNCPSGVEKPRRDVSIWNAFTNGPLRHGGLRKWLRPYRMGGTRFVLSLKPGRHKIVARYKGDGNVEAAASRAIILAVGTCPGTLWPKRHRGKHCVGRLAKAAAAMSRGYGSVASSVGAPRAGGAILDDGPNQIAFFGKTDLVVRHGSVQTANAATVLQLLSTRQG